MFKKIAGLLAIAAAAFVSTAGLSASAEEVFLRSNHSGKYVARTDGMLTASAASSGQALKLDMVRLDGNKVAFRVVSDASYVRAGVGSGTFLAGGSPHIRGWETFRLIPLGGMAHALKSEQNGKLVRAGVGQGSLLAAVSEGKPRAWEIFDIVPARAVQGQSGSRAAVSNAVRGSWRILKVAAIQSGHLTTLSDALSDGTRIDIAADGGMSANVGCNRINASIAQSGGSWQASSPIQTKMLCPDQAVMSIERSFTGALAAATQVTKSGSDLMLKNAGGETILVLRKR